MRRLIFLAILIAFSKPLCTGQDLAPTAVKQVRESHSTADFKQVHRRVLELVQKHSETQVLVVIDIDNTLLAMNQDLGSDQWFNWQSDLLKANPQSPDLVANDFQGLLDVQGTLFALSKMHPPEPMMPELVGKIQSLGVTTVVLTSRGYSYRDASERELNRNGYDLAKSALKITEERGLFMPFDPERPNAHGLNQEIISKIGSRRSLVTYSNGIYMTAGQHKGHMLRTLIARRTQDAAGETPPSFEAIVFVDDHDKHCSRMHEAYEDAPLDLVTFHYTREAGNVENFRNSSKRHVIEDWDRLKDFIEGVLVQ